MYEQQSRWKPEGNALRYYGLRNMPNMQKNTLRPSPKQLAIIRCLPCELTEKELHDLVPLVESQVVSYEEKTGRSCALRMSFCLEDGV